MFNSVSVFNPNNKEGITLFDFIALEIHSLIDACFNPCHTKTAIDNSAEIQYPPSTDKHWFCIVWALFHF